MKKIKVAIVRGPSLNPWEMQNYEPLREQFNLLAIGSTRNLYALSKINFAVTKLPCIGQSVGLVPFGIKFLYKYFGDPQYLQGFEKIISGFDIVHAAELTSAYSLQAVRAKRKGLVSKVTLNVYENIPLLPPFYAARDRLKAEVIKYTDHFIVSTQSSYNSLVAEGVDFKKISVVGAAIDTQFFVQATSDLSQRRFKRSKIGFRENDFIILSAGRLVWEKGWYDLLRAAHWINKYTRNATLPKTIRFLWIGEGPEKEQLGKLICDLHLDQIIILYGSRDFYEMPEIFRIADLFILPSIPTPFWNDQYGTVLIQAMSTGLPIIASQNAAIKEVLGSSGRYVIPQNFHELVEQILQFLLQPKLRSHIGKMNRRRVETKFDTRLIAQKIARIWNTITN